MPKPEDKDWEEHLKRVRRLEKKRQGKGAYSKANREQPEDPPAEPPPDSELVVPKADLGDVPSSLDGLITGEEGKNAHQILGTLVEADSKKVEAILGRTIINKKDTWFVGTINRALHLARHGIGGQYLDTPRPWMSQYIFDYVSTLPSIEGKSREQLVRGFQSAEEELRRHEMIELRRKEGRTGNA